MKKIKYYSVWLITWLFIAGTLTYASSSWYIGSLFEEISTNVFVIKNNAFKANSIHADALQKLSIQTDRIKDYAITSAKLATSLNLPADTKLNWATIMTSDKIIRHPNDVYTISSSAWSWYWYLASSCPGWYTKFTLRWNPDTVNENRVRSYRCNRTCSWKGLKIRDCRFKSTCYETLFKNTTSHWWVCVWRN